MSFFNDFSSLLSLSELKNKTTMSFVIGVGIVVVGKVKINSFDDNFIEIYAEKERVEIKGENLKISSIGYGEIVVSGKIKSINIGD